MHAQLKEPSQYESHNRSFPQLLRDFSHEATALIRDEMDLARSEITQKINQLGSGMTFLVVGGLVFFAGILVLLDAAVIALLQVLPPTEPWVAPLLVGGVVFLIGAMMLYSGRNKVKAKNLKPERTLKEMRHDRELFKEKTS